MTSEEEIPLRGGWVHTGIVRVGDTVRRPVSDRSAFVHRGLTYLEEVGFDAAPRFLGIDEAGRESLSFIPGEVLRSVGELADQRLWSGASLLRRLHDAGAGAPPDLRGDEETLLHGDAGPWNMIWSDVEAIALIDFDEMRAGSRIEELGYFAWKALRLKQTRLTPVEQGRRLHLLADAYGVPVGDDLLDAIDQSYGWMAAKGVRERWPPGPLARVAEERAWFRDARRLLKHA